MTDSFLFVVPHRHLKLDRRLRHGPGLRQLVAEPRRRGHHGPRPLGATSARERRKARSTERPRPHPRGRSSRWRCSGCSHSRQTIGRIGQLPGLSSSVAISNKPRDQPIYKRTHGSNCSKQAIQGIRPSLRVSTRFQNYCARNTAQVKKQLLLL